MEANYNAECRISCPNWVACEALRRAMEVHEELAEAAGQLVAPGTVVCEGPERAEFAGRDRHICHVDRILPSITDPEASAVARQVWPSPRPPIAPGDALQRG